MKSRESLESTLKTYSRKLENLDEMDKSLDATKFEPRMYLTPK
jgi:hypothetical protein